MSFQLVLHALPGGPSDAGLTGFVEAQQGVHVSNAKLTHVCSSARLTVLMIPLLKLLLEMTRHFVQGQRCWPGSRLPEPLASGFLLGRI